MKRLLRAVDVYYGSLDRAHAHYSKLLQRSTPRILRGYAQVGEDAEGGH